jgi:hypothetical protein
MAAFVVDRPGEGGLASCAVGAIEQRLGAVERLGMQRHPGPDHRVAGAGV